MTSEIGTKKEHENDVGQRNDLAFGGGRVSSDSLVLYRDKYSVSHDHRTPARLRRYSCRKILCSKHHIGLSHGKLSYSWNDADH